MKNPGWVIINKESGEAIFETFSKNLVDALNTEKYFAEPVPKYLARINKEIKESTLK